MSQLPYYICLLHYPILNRDGDVITTAITHMDLPDIARTACTYGFRKYFVVSPLPEQHEVIARIVKHWKSDVSEKYHPDRYRALQLVELVSSFDDVKRCIHEETGCLPEVVLTDARPSENATGYGSYREMLQDSKRDRPACLVFGTGWGVAPEFMPEVDRVLQPIYGPGREKGYNHLSVRAAVSAICDRLFGE